MSPGRQIFVPSDHVTSGVGNVGEHKQVVLLVMDGAARPKPQISVSRQAE